MDLLQLVFSLLLQCLIFMKSNCNQILIFQLQSQYSGRFVAVYHGGRVHAHALRPNRNTRFFITSNINITTKTTTITLESVKFRDRYLVMEKDMERLRLATPQDKNEQFEVVPLPTPIYISLKDSRGCFVGFNRNGEQVDPCSLTSSDPQTRLLLKVFIRKRKS